MKAEHRSVLAKWRVKDLLKIKVDVDAILDAVLDTRAYRFEQRAYEEAVAGLVIALEALDRGSRLADAAAFAEDDQKGRLEAQLRASMVEKGLG